VTEEVQVSCPCGARFQVPASLKGGLANCPQCGKAATVRGGPEPLFWLLLSVGIASVVILSAVLWIFGGAMAGGIALGIGTLVITILVMAS